jgi:hypothetical protein
MSRRLIAVACLAAFALSGCASGSRMHFPDEIEAWGHDLPTLGR